MIIKVVITIVTEKYPLQIVILESICFILIGLFTYRFNWINIGEFNCSSFFDWLV